MDPKDLNAGPDLQLYERVPIQNEVPDSRKFKVPIQKNEVPIQSRVPDSRKFKVPIQKVRYRYKMRYRIQEKSRYR